MTTQPAQAADLVTYSEFQAELRDNKVSLVRVAKDKRSAEYISTRGVRHTVYLVPSAAVEDDLFGTLAAGDIDVMLTAEETESSIDTLARWAGPVAWLLAFVYVFFLGPRPFIGPFGPTPGGMPGMEVTKFEAKPMKKGQIKIKFSDVAGCDGAKLELQEIVDFLRNTKKYSELGAKIPKGALLAGPPGTGKTLLAKAVAGEAEVPFFSCSASEFVETYIGLGASRVRELFGEAKKNAPCIVFIDEIDALGRQRTGGIGASSDERERTVNQLLTEMDGFESNKGVVVLGATNRQDILDSALVRPGRFDRRIQVEAPDVEGRVAILKVHAKEKSLAPKVDLTTLARQTPGMTGADLANLLNEGAIMAARKNKKEIDDDDIADALERITIGLEKKSAVMSEKKKRLVAYHEAGHAILGALMNDFDTVAKISIVPRGPAGGVTIFTPSEDRLNSGLYSKEFLQNRMCVALGGRIAEELLNGIDNVTSGATNDFQQCTQVAQTMVGSLGMSDIVGQRVVAQQPTSIFEAIEGTPPLSQKLRKVVDQEVRRIVDEQYQRGKFLLESNRGLLDELAELLMEKEKVAGADLMEMINRHAAEGRLVMGGAAMLAPA